MPVEIIGHDQNAYRTTTCRTCGSVLRYLPADVLSTDSSDYTGDVSTSYHIECPKCKKCLYVREP